MGAAAAAPPARGDGGGRGRGAFAGGAAEMFRALQMSGRGPDGYPLDVHPPKLPLPPQDPVWTKARRRDLPIARRCSRMRRRSAACRSAGRSRPSCGARWRSSRVRRISFDRRLRDVYRRAFSARVAGVTVAAAVQETTAARDADADLRVARRRRSSARPLSAGQSHPPADTGDCVSARRRMVRRHADDGAGLQALLRAGRIRDGVDRVSPDAVDHVSRQRRGRPHRGAMAEGQRRHARARPRSHLPVGHIGRRPPGGGRRRWRRRGMFEGNDNSNQTSAVRCVLDAYGPTRFDAWMHRPRRSARRCSRPS